MASPLVSLIRGVALAAASPALAGPPYLTDDPQPTDTGHWEIYNFVSGASTPGSVSDAATGDSSGEAGLDLNFGAARNVQLTAVLPLGFDDPQGPSADGPRVGTGVIELAAKYRFAHAEDHGWRPDIAVFPRLFLPTDSRFGPPRVNLFLPIWAEKDFGPWQVFGGGGYQINPGPDQRDFWQGGVAVNRSVSRRLSLGVELFSQGRDSADDGGLVTVNFGATLRLVEHWSLLASAGPSRTSGGGQGGVFYLSLKADY